MAPERGRTRPDAVGDSAPSAEQRVLFRGPDRVSRSPRWRRANNSGESGKPAARAVKRRSDTPAATGRQPLRPSSRGRSQGPFDLGGQLSKAQRASARAGDQDDIARRPLCQGIAVHDRSKPAPNAVPNHRAADLRTNGQPDARRIAPSRDQTGDKCCRPAPSMPRNAGEIGSPAERRIASHARTPSGRSNGQALTPFFPPCGDDSTPVLGRHPRQEPMDALPSPVMRLKRTLHSTGTPDTKIALLGGSALVYVSRQPAVKGHPKAGRSSRRRLRMLRTLSTPV